MKERDRGQNSPVRSPRGCQHTKSPIRGSVPANQVIDFDSKCQSCQCASAAERTVLFQSFKMACLAYKPNSVTLTDGQVVPRQDAVEMQRKISRDLDTVNEQKFRRQQSTLNRFEDIEREIKEMKLVVDKLGENTVVRYTQDKVGKTFSHLTEADSAAAKNRENPYNVTILNNGNIVDGEVDSAETGS